MFGLRLFGSVCLSWRVVPGLQSVRLVGAVERHASEASVLASKNYHRYFVLKINVNGVRQKRYISVDADEKILWNFNVHMRLRKQLPLQQLVQVWMVDVRVGGRERRTGILWSCVPVRAGLPPLSTVGGTCRGRVPPRACFRLPRPEALVGR